MEKSKRLTVARGRTDATTPLGKQILAAGLDEDIVFALLVLSNYSLYRHSR